MVKILKRLVPRWHIVPQELTWWYRVPIDQFSKKGWLFRKVVDKVLEHFWSVTDKYIDITSKSCILTHTIWKTIVLRISWYEMFANIAITENVMRILLKRKYNFIMKKSPFVAALVYSRPLALSSTWRVIPFLALGLTDMSPSASGTYSLTPTPYCVM